MKIKIELEDKDDQQETDKALRMLKSDDMYSKMWDIAGILREVRKYGLPEATAIERIQDIVNGVDFDADGWI